MLNGIYYNDKNNKDTTKIQQRYNKDTTKIHQKYNKDKTKTVFTVVSLQENKCTTFLDKFNSSNQNILDMLYTYIYIMLLH